MSEPMNTVRVKVTNHDRSPRGVNIAGGGTLVVAPGGTSKEITVTEAELFQMRTTFKVEELGEGEPIMPAQNTNEPRAPRMQRMWNDIAKLKAEVAELRALAVTGDEPIKQSSAYNESDEASGVDKDTSIADTLAMANDRDVSFMTFKSAASKLLGDKMPTKKDEIVAALEEMATRP